MFEGVYENFPKPKPGHDKIIKKHLYTFLERSILELKEKDTEEEVHYCADNSAMVVLSPLQIDEIRKSVCLALLDLDQSEASGAALEEYDKEMAQYLLEQKKRTVSKGTNKLAKAPRVFFDRDEDDHKYILAIVKVFEHLLNKINASADVHVSTAVPKLDQDILQENEEHKENEESSPSRPTSPFLPSPPPCSPREEGVDSEKPDNKIGEPAPKHTMSLASLDANETSDDSTDAKKKKTLLAKLAEGKVWGVPRTLFRLEKIEGLDELKDTPFMVEHILDILSVLNELAASPSSIKQNLILLCPSEDEAELFSSRLRLEITSSAKHLEEFQNKLNQDDSGLSKLKVIVKDVVKDLKNRLAKANTQGEAVVDDAGSVDGSTEVKREFKLVNILLSVLRRHPLSRSTIYTVFTQKYIEKKARDKHGAQSTALSLTQLQRETVEFCERLALAMTRLNMPKVEYASASMLFHDTSNPSPWAEFFGAPGGSRSEISILELVQTCCPITKSAGVVAFLHKSVQEYYAASAIMQQFKAVRRSLSSSDDEILCVLDMLHPGNSGVKRPSQLSKEEVMSMLTSYNMHGDSNTHQTENQSHPTASTKASASSHQVADLNRISQDVIKLIRGMMASGLHHIDLEQNEGVRDFLVDLLLSSSECQKSLIIIARLCSSRIGSAFAMARENIWTVLTMQNPRREGGSLLHVACREGNLPLLQTALRIMQDCYHDRLWADIRRDSDSRQSLLMRGKSKFKMFPIQAAALHGYRDCCEEILRMVDDVKPEKNVNEDQMINWKQSFLKHALELDFSSIQLNDADAAMIAVALESLQSLRKLDISNNRIGSAGCKHLGQKLKFATSLKCFDISHNAISEEGCLLLVHPQKRTVVDWPVGDKVMIDKTFDQVVQENGRITVLDRVMSTHNHANLGTVRKDNGPDDLQPYQVKWDDGTESGALYVKDVQRPFKKVKLKMGSTGTVVKVGNDGSVAIDFDGLQLWLSKTQLDSQSCTVETLQGLGCAVQLTELNLSKCSIGPEGSRAVASVLHRLSALTRLQLHDEVGDDIRGITTLAAGGVLVKEGCLLPLAPDQSQQHQVVQVNFLRVHAHVTGLFDTYQKARFICEHTPDVKSGTERLRKLQKQLQKQLEEAMTLSYCAAKVASGACIDLLNELSDAVDLYPQSSTLRGRKSVVSFNIDSIRTQRGRAAAVLFLQLAYQEPESTGLPGQVDKITWPDLSGMCDAATLYPSPARANLMRWINAGAEQQHSDATLLTISEHIAEVTAVKVFPCGKLLASASADGDVLICSTATGEVKCRLDGHNGQGRNGCLCYTRWDTAKKNIVEFIPHDACPLDGHVGRVNSVDVSHDGSRLLSGGDREILVWKRKGATSLFVPEIFLSEHSGR